ncbi:hypothetical protein ACFQ3L_09860 [Lacticaseibacillus jixianensis]|uniref:Uncharacterized protein n=1 Tax=Lacticaseibacillus jixianensis TaxID=2486012 RepID=A0ABW4BA39_9LACO|nr:hypothetical protein [Lacticaseibacillus jixianensis]
MHEIPENMAQVAALVAKSEQNHTPLSEDAVIQGGLQNWIQELLDEGIEGGYLTAKLSAAELTITDIGGKQLLQTPQLNATALVPAFKADPHMTLMKVQTTMRSLIDQGQF